MGYGLLGLGFRVQGAGFSVHLDHENHVRREGERLHLDLSLVFSVQGLAFGVWCSGFRIQGLGFGVYLGFRA